MAELAEAIKTLRAANTIEAAPERTSSRRLVGEEPVTTRIRRSKAQSVFAPLEAAQVSTTPIQDPPASAEKGSAEIIAIPSMGRESRPEPQADHRQTAIQRRAKASQQSLF